MHRTDHKCDTLTVNADTLFNYVVGYPWNPEDLEHLRIYSYHSQIQRGTQSDAEEFLEYVKSQNPHNPYCIYKVSFSKMEVT
jgi:hypothetical protein